ncbi:uncharacterized protein RCC_04240 [Ramularia collo-cygni]|uniref:Uncharacterized protein n=1 Tax=Ramularia collo-cygni TaxID=112498 RepID=A0A2D3V4D6_9PEZI|nr:uncharacterized protein RCC_04240 [Ramularia collo-cygni]CZT18396.1 uncharacterized protein RCC_04240 [Ramularia collo-cygni]
MNLNIPQITCASIETDGFDSTADSAWFTHHTAPMDDEPETGAHTYQTEALQSYLAGKCNLSITATTLCSLQNHNETPTDLRSRIFNLLESALFELPRRYTSSLISLLLEIHSSDDPTWKNLPGFATSWSDMWKQDQWRSALAIRDPATRSKRREAHIHRAYVEASCAMVAVGPTAEDGLMPLSWGYECISEALECQHAVWDFEVPAAAMWVKIAGKRLKEGAERGERSWALEREGRLWGPGPMSLQRWEFWMRRFEEMEDVGNAIANAGSEGARTMRT